MLFGGEDKYGNCLNDTYIFFNEFWSKILLKTNFSVPTKCKGASLCFTNTCFVLFGGYNNEKFLNHTWLFIVQPNFINPLLNDIYWRELTIDINPCARAYSSMVFDSLTNQLVLFGGSTGEKILNDTWLFSKKTNTWTCLEIVNSPCFRFNASMCYDFKFENIILFGGQNENIQNLNDIWLFSTKNNTWSCLEISNSPSPRYGASMIYDFELEKIILVGGHNNENFLNDIWILELY